MLEELHIQNYALLDNVHVEFSEGLNILSGETGAGKSILAGALGLLLGNKADTNAIRNGAEEIIVSGMLSIKNSKPACNWLKEKDISFEDESVLLRRVVKRTGRGTIYIETTPVTRSELQEFTSFAIDMIGQHEHQALLKIENHREYLDSFGGFFDKSQTMIEEFKELSTLRKEYSDFQQSEQERLREIDLLQFAINEIDQANMREGEEETLEKTSELLSQSEKIFELTETIYQNIAESRNGSLAFLRNAMEAMQQLVSIDNTHNELSERLENAFYEIEDIGETIRSYESNIEFSPEKLEETQERLSVIRKMKKKYGTTEKAVLEYAESCRNKLSRLQNYEEDMSELENNIKQKEQAVMALAQELSNKRKEAAVILKNRVEPILHSLGMKDARFDVSIERKKSKEGTAKLGPYGYDDIEFVIAPNKGEPLKPLRSIASGGELSRIMLALKTILSGNDSLSTLVFDEIDAGIGGKVGVAIGEHLYNLAENKQILCITHLASIAARADNHIRIEKTEQKDRTVTNLQPISDEDRVAEIARMLSGDAGGEASYIHARQMLKSYGRIE